MLKNLLNFALSKTEEGKALHFARPLISATDAFFYETPLKTSSPPYIRDSVDTKRWMILVIIALIPAILMAIWNTGLQKFVYSSGDYKLMGEYLAATSFDSYFAFASKNSRYLTILKQGLAAFLPLVFISYVVGGLWEFLFATIRKHEIAEGFLVTGMLYPLILPPTMPYWMVALGISFGVVVGKELFGGTGMNILNPALVGRCFLFFAFPSRMSGDMYVGTNPTTVNTSIQQMKNTSGIDGYTSASPLSSFNVGGGVKRIHVDTIAANNGAENVQTIDVIERQLDSFGQVKDTTVADLNSDQLYNFMTTPTENGGLDLAPDLYQSAQDFYSLKHGIADYTTGNFFFGNQIGCFGETSTFACLLGALFLIFVGVGSWRTMLSMGAGAFLTALLFQFIGEHAGVDGGAWNPAKFVLPAYKHLILGGFAFGLAFMVTDPVSSPGTNLAKWIYGFIVGFLVIIIRVINPAYPEGVMIAILFGNLFAPLIDHYSVRSLRRHSRVATK